MGWIASLWRRRRRSTVKSEWEDRRLTELERSIGHRFARPQLLVQALKHRSYAYARQEGGLESNERLEFLGDAVLDLVVADFFFLRFADKREGELTQMKSQMVSRSSLSRKARSLELGRFILLSQEERQAGGQYQASILSDAFEALIGAIYLDGGIGVSRRFIERFVLNDYEESIQREENINFKSRLLEHVQSQGQAQPQYHVRDEEGPDHCKVFNVEVIITGDRIGQGRGRSKKEAQQMAAKDALQHLGAL